MRDALAIVSLVDADEVMTHPDFRRKLEAIGFGFFIPVFFVTSGVRFDLGALTASATNLAVAATAIGRELGLIDAATSAALVGAGLLSVLVFPLAGLVLLRRAAAQTGVHERAGVAVAVP